MARVILSEYAAKRLLIGEDYKGVSVDKDSIFSTSLLSTGLYVVKVDAGIKKRNQNGLVKLNLDETAALAQAAEFIKSGYPRVLIEPMIPHQENTEQYISCTLLRYGVAVLHSKKGGNTVEHQTELVRKNITRSDFLSGTDVVDKDIPSSVLNTLLSTMRNFNISFIEINPFILNDTGTLLFLDAAIEIDSSKLHLLPEWVEEHTHVKNVSYTAEAVIKKLDSQSTASFSLTIFDDNASVFTLLSGGGASLVVLDAFVDTGMQSYLANYGEYSGAPTREETSYYTTEILKLLFASTASRKVLVIAGGVANFTDIRTTFSGIIDSCKEFLPEFKKQSVMVIVRRGGPRQVEGLASLKTFFEENNIPAVVSDSSMPLPHITVEAQQFIENSL